MSKADDMKNTHFKPFTDDTNGPEGERAVRDLKLHGNIPDAYAETYTDCMLGCDMGRGQLPLHCAGYLGLHRWLTEMVNEIDAAGNVRQHSVRDVLRQHSDWTPARGSSVCVSQGHRP